MERKKSNIYMRGYSPLWDHPDYEQVAINLRCDYENAKDVYDDAQILFVTTVTATVVFGALAVMFGVTGQDIEYSCSMAAAAATAGAFSLLSRGLYKKTKEKYQAAYRECEDAIDKYVETSRTGWFGLEIG